MPKRMAQYPTIIIGSVGSILLGLQVLPALVVGDWAFLLGILEVQVDPDDYARGLKDHINIKISHSDSRPNTRGIPEIMCCGILVFMWSFGALYTCNRLKRPWRLPAAFQFLWASPEGSE